MRREVFVVARDRPDLYRYLSQTFADAKNVEVIWDRRTEERRRAEDGTPRDRIVASATAAPAAPPTTRSAGSATCS